jgi:bacteriocin biosynthesis cyclodehydratase domain-containing protein
MRPALKPGLLPVWRNADTLQIGVDHRRAIALTGMARAAGLISLLDGSRDLSQLLAAADELGIPAATVHRVLSLLAAGGALDDPPAGFFRGLPHGLHRRLATELATTALAHGDSDGGARTLARRQHACVQVSGLSPIGLSTASLLAAAGIGSVVTAGWLPALPASPAAAPRAGAPPAGAPRAGAPRAGAPPAGSPRAGAAPAGSPRAAAPAGSPPAGAPRAGSGWQRPPSSLRAGRGDRTPDLVILINSYRRDLPAALLRAGVPHLTASASEAIGVVGPLVVPGRTACLRCLDLARADRDPAWPLILAQLGGGGADPPACDAILAMAVAAQAAAQALSFVDRGGAATAAVNGTLELVLPDWRWRRRTWLRHEWCPCGRSGPDDPQ